MFFQILACFFDVIKGVGDIPEPVIVRLLLIIENRITDNWVAWSILLFFIVVIYEWFFKTERTQDENGFPLTRVLFVANLVFGLRLYSISSITEKISLVENNIFTFVITIVVMLLALLTLRITANIRKADKDFKDLLPEERLDENIESGANDSKATNLDGFDKGLFNDLDEKKEKEYQMKHPCAYAFKSFAKRREILKNQKFDHKLKLNEATNKREIEDAEKGVKNTNSDYVPPKQQVFFTVLATALTVGVLILGVVFLHKQGFDAFKTLIGLMIDNTEKVTGEFNRAREVVTSFLLSVGVLFLFAITVITVFLLIQTTLRLLINTLFLSTLEDTQRLMMFWRAIKIFMFGTLEGVVRPLLFLPEFLECVEEMLLDTNIADIVNEEYSKKTEDVSSEKEQNNKTETDRKEFVQDDKADDNSLESKDDNTYSEDITD